MKKVIVITGTPGTGKSTLAKKLAKETRLTRLDISQYYKDISISFSKEKKCYTVDVKKLEKLVKEKLKESEGLIIDSHIAHLLKKVDLSIVLTCKNLKMLEKRLQKRGYSKKKIRENLDAEIFQVCLLESKEKHKTIEFDCQEKDMLNKVKKKL
ncbi:MAG: kinase [Nanoarchaeota archaeon]|nr:kinase [Nanoarchaeota archaeon]